jgi:transcriptional regulator with XRE-family HTH domain
MKSELNFSKLRDLRKACGWTTEQVVKKTGVSLGYINRIERGFVTEIHNQQKREAILNVMNEMNKELAK